MRNRWADAIRPHVRDETALDLIMLLSDGLYFNNSLAEPGDDQGAMRQFVPTGASLDRLIALVVDATTRAPE